MQEFIINDCWNKIGVWGKEKPRCPELDKLIHCNNCPVYAEAGRTLLGRSADKGYLEQWLGNLSNPRDDSLNNLSSALSFRLGDEWFALPCNVIKEITHCSKHHSLPHRKNPVLRGMVNVRGELLLCFSLGYLFKLHKSEKETANNHIHERYIVISDEQESYTFPVSEVRHIIKYNPDDMDKPPSTIDQASQSYIRGIIRQQDTNIGLLDENLLLAALHRNI